MLVNFTNNFKETASNQLMQNSEVEKLNSIFGNAFIMLSNAPYNALYNGLMNDYNRSKNKL